MSECSNCAVYVCMKGETERVPKNCPMALTPLVDTRDIFAQPEIRTIARASALVESRGYMRWTRVEETIEFARSIGADKIGLAFCMGLRNEAKILGKVFEANGLEVVSIICKTGAIPKEDCGIADDEKVRPGSFEAACNPVAQALILNEAGTKLNVIVGLCVGHDSLFTKFSRALVTTLIAKDRVLAHNPVGALNCAYGYYGRPLFQAHKGSE